MLGFRKNTGLKIKSIGKSPLFSHFLMQVKYQVWHNDGNSRDRVFKDISKAAKLEEMGQIAGNGPYLYAPSRAQQVITYPPTSNFRVYLKSGGFKKHFGWLIDQPSLHVLHCAVLFTCAIPKNIPIIRSSLF